MNTVHFLVKPLLDLFERLRVVTMPEMKAALGTRADVTVFRKLSTLPYRSSYSERGRFYTLDSIAHFDTHGLWFCREACFSQQGTAPERTRRQAQLALRHSQAQADEAAPEPLRAAIVLFYSLLDEQQRRLYAGLESLKQGHGGDRQMAQRLGLDADTVARGRQELLTGAIERQRVRRSGGGRPRAEKKRPNS